MSTSHSRRRAHIDQYAVFREQNILLYDGEVERAVLIGKSLPKEINSQRRKQINDKKNLWYVPFTHINEVLVESLRNRRDLDISHVVNKSFTRTYEKRKVHLFDALDTTEEMQRERGELIAIIYSTLEEMNPKKHERK